MSKATEIIHSWRMRQSPSDSDLVAKRPESDAIATAVDRFLANGGKIEVLPQGASSGHASKVAQAYISQRSTSRKKGAKKSAEVRGAKTPMFDTIEEDL